MWLSAFWICVSSLIDYLCGIGFEHLCVHIYKSFHRHHLKLQAKTVSQDFQCMWLTDCPASSHVKQSTHDVEVSLFKTCLWVFQTLENTSVSVLELSFWSRHSEHSILNSYILNYYVSVAYTWVTLSLHSHCLHSSWCRLIRHSISFERYQCWAGEPQVSVSPLIVNTL
jgi:hypothetical protein